ERGELGGHGPLGGLATGVVGGGEGLDVAHGEHPVDLPLQRVLERVQPGPHPGEAAGGVAPPHDESGVAHVPCPRLGPGVNKVGCACPSPTSSPSGAPPSTTSSPSPWTSPRRRWSSSAG